MSLLPSRPKLKTSRKKYALPLVDLHVSRRAVAPKVTARDVAAVLHIARAAFLFRFYSYLPTQYRLSKFNGQRTPEANQQEKSRRSVSYCVKFDTTRRTLGWNRNCLTLLALDTETIEPWKFGRGKHGNVSHTGEVSGAVDEAAVTESVVKHMQILHEKYWYRSVLRFQSTPLSR